jgi:dienelactone hydrolase
MPPVVLYGLLVCLLCVTSLDAAEPRPATTERGTIPFQPRGDQANVPERYRLAAHQFPYEMQIRAELPTSGILIYDVRFPSPIETPYRENNTVHGEYYRPAVEGRFPGVVVLDILGGAEQIVSRSLATQFARNGIGAIFMQMPYYGPRRPPGSSVRLVSSNYQHSLEAVRQTVLDIRRTVAWLEARPEIDNKRLGIVGTSLGSFMGSLAAEMEPKVSRVVLLLGGGGIVDGYYDDPRFKPFRALWETLGGTREKLAQMLAPVDPLTCAANLKDRKVLIMAGKRDDIVPPRMTEALWKATGQQKIIWYDCTHAGAALYIVPALEHMVQHLKAE